MNFFICYRKPEDEEESIKNISSYIIRLNIDEIDEDDKFIMDNFKGECYKTISVGHADTIITSLIQLNEREIVCGRKDKSIKILDIKTGQCVKTLTLKNNPMYTMIKITDDIIANSSYKEIKIWNTTSNKCILTLTEQTGLITDMIKLNDKYIASCSTDTTIKIWDIKEGNCAKTLRGHKYPITSLIKLNDDKIVSESFDGTIKIWNVNEGICEKTL
jgi:WD40 repeat protein